MSKKSKKKKIKSLGLEISLVQLEKFMNDFDNAMKKDTKKGLKRFVLVIGPLMLSLIGFLIFKNPTILMIGTSITGIGSFVILSKDFIKDMKGLNSNNYKSNSDIINIEQEKDVDEILQEGIGKAKEEDFYSKKYKSVIKQESCVETEEEKKYREALEKQQGMINKNYPNLKILDNDENYLDKEETMIQIVREVDAYAFAYNLPPLNISNGQWDVFFDSIYSLFEKKGKEKEFYNSMSQIGRFAFAKALINKRKQISIYDFVENLYYLESLEEITKQELAILQQEILSKLPTTQIYNFSEYQTGKRGK